MFTYYVSPFSSTFDLDSNDVYTQVEMDPEMTVRMLPLELQGLPESYMIAHTIDPYAHQNMLMSMQYGMLNGSGGSILGDTMGIQMHTHQMDSQLVQRMENQDISQPLSMESSLALSMHGHNIHDISNPLRHLEPSMTTMLAAVKDGYMNTLETRTYDTEIDNSKSKTDDRDPASLI